eukprot:UN27619
MFQYMTEHLKTLAAEEEDKKTGTDSTNYLEFLQVLTKITEYFPAMVDGKLLSGNADTQEKLWELLDYTDTKLVKFNKPLFPVYADFIAALTSANPEDVFCYVSGNLTGSGQVFSEKLDLRMISKLLEKTYTLYAVNYQNQLQNKMMQNQQGQMGQIGQNTHYNQQTNPQLHQQHQQHQHFLNRSGNNRQAQNQPVIKRIYKEEVDILIALLKIVESVSKYNEFQAQIAETGLGYIQMFNLLQCAFPIRLKGQVLRTLTAMVHDSNVNKIWDMLHKYQVLSTNANGQQGDGVQGDLKRNEVRGSKATYPVTIAFCELIKKLTQVGEIPNI